MKSCISPSFRTARRLPGGRLDNVTRGRPYALRQRLPARRAHRSLHRCRELSHMEGCNRERSHAREAVKVDIASVVSSTASKVGLAESRRPGLSCGTSSGSAVMVEPLRVVRQGPHVSQAALCYHHPLHMRLEQASGDSLTVHSSCCRPEHSRHVQCVRHWDTSA